MQEIKKHSENLKDQDFVDWQYKKAIEKIYLEINFLNKFSSKEIPKIEDK